MHVQLVVGGKFTYGDFNPKKRPPRRTFLCQAAPATSWLLLLTLAVFTPSTATGRESRWLADPAFVGSAAVMNSPTVLYVTTPLAPLAHTHTLTTPSGSIVQHQATNDTDPRPDSPSVQPLCEQGCGCHCAWSTSRSHVA